MAHLYHPALCRAGLAANDATAAMRLLARALYAEGKVRPSFEAAVLAREQRSPTGLPLPGRKVAIPHADPEHVSAPAIAAATLARPVTFQEMGNPEQGLAVEVILMLALPDQKSAQHELVRLIERCQDVAFVDRLCAAPDDPALFALIAEEEP